MSPVGDEGGAALRRQMEEEVGAGGWQGNAGGFRGDGEGWRRETGQGGVGTGR